MLETYKTEDKLNKKKTAIEYGQIGDRFQCNIKDLGIVKKYDLIYGHWSLGYLKD